MTLSLHTPEPWVGFTCRAKACVRPAPTSRTSTGRAGSVSRTQHDLHSVWAAHATTHQSVNHRDRNTIFSAPVGERHLRALCTDPHRRSAVNVLLRSRGPQDVTGAVPKVIVYALNRIEMAWLWPPPNVFNKALDACLLTLSEAPTVADLYPATTVVAEPLLFGVVAPADGGRQACHLGGPAEAVRPCSGSKGIITPAAARDLLASTEVPSEDTHGNAALTDAAPLNLPAFVTPLPRNHGEAAKNTPHHVDGVV